MDKYDAVLLTISLPESSLSVFFHKILRLIFYRQPFCRKKYAEKCRKNEAFFLEIFLYS